MSETISKPEEIIIPTDLKTFLTDVADHRFGYRLGEPWRYNEDTLGVVVPILRDNASDRQYITMYEVLNDLNIKDTGHISQVEFQNKTGLAIFIRAGTIFTGSTQSRAAQHSGVYEKEKEIVNVRCVHQSHGISSGTKMKFGDIAPAAVTIDLMSGDQYDVWSSVENYTRGSKTSRVYRTGSSLMPCSRRSMTGSSSHHFMAPHRVYGLFSSSNVTHELTSSSSNEDDSSIRETGFRSDNLLKHLQEKQSTIDDMMQRVPLFPDQAGAIIFNPNGVIAVELFDHPKSWEAIKKEVIAKFGDKIKETQAEHLFELKPEIIPIKFREFIEKLDKFTERTVRKDNYSETREVRGEGIIGEYTIVKGQPIHVLLLKEDNT